ncbi:PREDICTED: E3 ubiquitin ligase BIG BROTHER-related-like isoform X2 [Camelina sativa]|uniref:E3 ubiquitin ligase BIG BROTHER-related-like isoform X2 n=1 Tax=Camelina sativa TaxID=90675 RepID=A0ABM0XM33_CAMSA|nr:PREDICTED: E3 ubiquitin ligase BIG BROTHER-related-like isoform X2 [Camelina sativa]
MPMENDNGHASNVVVTAEQATKINETEVRLPIENRQTGVVSDAGSVGNSERGEQGDGETAVAVAVAVEENGSNLVAELPPRSSSARVPFTNLNQIDADLALARTLQEQERAYMMLTMNSEISDYGSWETGSYVYDEDEFDDPENEDEDDDEDEYETDNDLQEDAPDVHANENDQEDDGNSDIEEVAYSDDEAYARALQDAEERDMAARLSALSGLANRVEVLEDESHTSQDAWDEMDPDELSYEELLALGDIVGTESRGLSADTIASLPSKRYKDGDNQNGTNESCVICRLDYEDDDDLILLPCKHSYHSECINNWLKINKVCPVCSAEVSASTSGQS